MPRQPDLPPLAIPVNPPINAHRMMTRAKQGYLMPKKLFDLSVTTTASKISPIPSTYRQALKDPNWHAAMLEEFNALLRNDTWSLIPCPAGANVVSGKWIFRHKLNPNGSLSRYKA
jgi:histone deacetylase 1/2